MITEFFLWVMGNTAKLVLGLFPSGPDPAPALGGASSGIGTVFTYATGFGQWVPWGAVGAGLLIVVALLGVAGVVKLVRIVASFLTFGGGGAA